MRAQLVIAASVLSAACAASQPSSVLEQQWLAFPYQALPALPDDEGLPAFQLALKRDGALKTAQMRQNIFDAKNNYANFTLPDDSFLEFVLWNSPDQSGYIVVNRYRANEQVFKVWRLLPGRAPQAVSPPFQLTAQELKAAYRRVTGQTLQGKAAVWWEFPRFGTTVTASFQPVSDRLMRQCKAISDVEYDCGQRLNIATFKWDGTKFVKSTLAKEAK